MPFKSPGMGKLMVQPKLTVNTPGDRYEQEADAMAGRVMRMAAPGAEATPVTGLIGRSVQRKCTNCDEENKRRGTVMRKAASGNDSMNISPAFSSALHATRGGGSPLPEGTRNFMENAFSADFSGVRVHADSRAAEMNRGINAKAFTYGNDIYFGRGKYSPNTFSGKTLLAHELKHTLQQQGVISRTDDDINPIPNSIVGNGTTEELKNEITRLETFLIENPNSGWKNTVQNKIISLKTYLAEREDSTLPDCDSQLLFNGESLCFSGGRSDCYPAVSGPKQIDDQGIEFFDYSIVRQNVAGGPIPEGVYWLDPRQLVNTGYRFYNPPNPAWGKKRITIHTFHSTHTFGRGGFFIHGGTEWGSVGCIDLTSYMDSFAQVLSIYNNCGFWSCNPCKVLLTVKYKSNRAILK